MLIDTNIILELSKKQKQSESCRDLFNAINRGLINEDVYITKFAISATQALIGERDPKLVKKILLMIFQEKIKIFETDTKDEITLLATLCQLKLDFDDAIQYLAANRLNTYLVTFDKDFKGTGLEIKTPAQVLKKVLA